MFRYIAMAWASDDPSAQQTAVQLASKLRTPDSGWCTALSRPGLSVFTSGTQSNINEAYVLAPDHGVLLGKLFRRTGGDQVSAPDIALTGRDVGEIMQSCGRTLIDSFWGRYVALLYDAASGGIRVLRDPSGTLPCYLIHDRGAWLVFSWLEDILTLMPSVPVPTINWDYVAVHVPARMLESRETALNGVTQVVAGEAVLLRNDCKRSELYWNPVDVARAVGDEDHLQAAAALRDSVRACVWSWAQCYDPLMLRLSGGVDSSIVLSCLDAESTSARVTCINYYSAGSDSDERAYARLAAARARRQLIERERDSAFRLEPILNVARTPKPSYYFEYINTCRTDAELAAAHGASALFTGAGGDQLFLQVSACWPAADYLRVHGLDAGFLSVAMDSARLGRVSVWRAIRLAFLDRLRSGPADPFDDVGTHMALVNPHVVAAARRDRRFMHPALASNADVPFGKLVQIRHLMYSIEYYDLLHPELAPESIHPLLSQPVMELCLRLPTYVLTAGGRGRALARQAFAADLPPEIALRRSKGGNAEQLKSVLLRNRDFVRTMLLDGLLVKQGLLDRTRLEEVLSGRPTAIASPLMELFLYLSTEAWLNRWSTNRQRAAA